LNKPFNRNGTSKRNKTVSTVKFVKMKGKRLASQQLFPLFSRFLFIYTSVQYVHKYIFLLYIPEGSSCEAYDLSQKLHLLMESKGSLPYSQKYTTDIKNVSYYW
jgi:hypothetical protein